jgi:hypothetical protein
MPNRLRMTILGALEKLKPSDRKGFRGLKWWSWGAPFLSLLMSSDV